MRANVLSSPTFRYLQGNEVKVEFEDVNPKPWGEIDDDEKAKTLNEKFENLDFGVSEEAVKLNQEKTNFKKVIIIDKDTELERIKFDFTEQNSILLDDIKIIANENTSSNLLLDYEGKDDIKTFRNSTLRVYAKENSNVNIYLVTRQGQKAKVWQSVGIVEEKNAKVNIYQIEIGFEEKLYSLKTTILGEMAKFNLEGAYFLENEQKLDLLYNVDIYGKQTDSNITVNGIQKDISKKTFKGTLDFKRGSKASKGSELENVTLLDKTVKSKSLPIILCTEEDITGNHAASAGQIDEEMLFYIMSRGFSRQEATSLIVEARLVPVIDKLPDKKLRDEILLELRNKMTRK